MTKCIFLPVIFLLLLAGCSSNHLIKSDVIQMYHSGYSSQDYPEHDAVYIFDDYITEVTQAFRFVEQHYLLKILRNPEEFNRKLYFPVYPDEKLQKLIIRIINPDGTIETVNRDEYVITKGYDAGLIYFSDFEQIRVILPPLQDNTMIEIYFKKSSELLFHLADWYPTNIYPTAKSTYSIQTYSNYFIIPDINMFRYRKYNAPEVNNYYENLGGGLAKVIFELTDLPVLEIEDKAPPGLGRMWITFQLGKPKTWDDQANYYKELIESQAPAPEANNEMADYAKGLTKDCPDIQSKLQKCYNEVQNIMYFSENIGALGGITPHEPAETLSKAYGDCKDKAALLVMLLRHNGIKAYTALIKTRSAGYFDDGFPSLDFNHAIVMAELEDEIIWMDPTQKLFPPNTLSHETAGRYALVLKDDKAELIKTPEFPAFFNQLSFTSVFDLINETPQLTITMQIKGEMEYDMYKFLYDLKNEDSLGEFASLFFSGQAIKSHVSDYKLMNNQEYDGVNLIITLDPSGFINQQNDLLLINTCVMNMIDDYKFLRKEKRKFPIEFSTTISKNETVIVKYDPQQYQITNMPNTSKSEKKEFFFCSFSDNKPGQYTSTMNFEISQTLFPAKDFHILKETTQQILKSQNEKIILKKL